MCLRVSYRREILASTVRSPKFPLARLPTVGSGRYLAAVVRFDPSWFKGQALLASIEAPVGGP